MKLKIHLSYDTEFVSKTREKLIGLLKRTNNLRSLEIFFEHRFMIDSSLIESICSIVPDHVKHLDIETKMLNHINLVLKRLQHLTSATFRRTFLTTENLAQWSSQLKRDITYRSDQGFLYTWLGKPFGQDRIKKPRLVQFSSISLDPKMNITLLTPIANLMDQK
jgi:hypothetical protein